MLTVNVNRAGGGVPFDDGKVTGFDSSVVSGRQGNLEGFSSGHHLKSFLSV